MKEHTFSLQSGEYVVHSQKGISRCEWIWNLIFTLLLIAGLVILIPIAPPEVLPATVLGTLILALLILSNLIYPFVTQGMLTNQRAVFKGLIRKTSIPLNDIENMIPGNWVVAVKRRTEKYLRTYSVPSPKDFVDAYQKLIAP